MPSLLQDSATQGHPARIGGTVHEFNWSWRDRPLTIVYETLGTGHPILLLPALSTVSTRAEMNGIAQRLAPDFQVIALDWPGFGDSSRSRACRHPNLYQACLQAFVQSVVGAPVVAIAAGHGAGYVMKLAHQAPELVTYAILVAPTWRGPLPTMGAYRWLCRGIEFLIGLPVIGQWLYQLNTAPRFLRWMYRRHVYTHTEHLTNEFIDHKWRITQRPQSRFASAAFVTGALDPVHSSSAFVNLFQPASIPVLAVIGEQTPPKSRAEMEVLVHFCGTQCYRMPGSLGLHEEYPEYLMSGLLPFLKKYLLRSK
jgi:pimeloyl-ACP methyl ester carboxylesterase